MRRPAEIIHNAACEMKLLARRLQQLEKAVKDRDAGKIRSAMEDVRARNSPDVYVDEALAAARGRRLEAEEER